MTAVQITTEEMISLLEEDGYVSVKKDSMSEGVFFDTLDKGDMVDYLEEHGYTLVDDDEEMDEKTISTNLFGYNVSAEHVRLLEILREKLQFGNPTKLIDIIQNAQI